MVVDVEQEYNSYICKGWEKLSDATKNILKFHRKQERAYNTISLWSIQFLQSKLENLETEKS